MKNHTTSSDSATPKPIETRYKGYRFRSRLEARWAVFFDALGFEWGYEVEGYHLPDGQMYLPDFWLPQVSMFAEVKPDRFSDEERAKCAALPKACIMLEGLPAQRPYWVASRFGDDWDCCDVILGDGHLYHLTENRLYSWTGADRDDPASWYEAWQGTASYQAQDAIDAARSARFEHGESG